MLVEIVVDDLHSDAAVDEIGGDGDGDTAEPLEDLPRFLVSEGQECAKALKARTSTS